MSEPVSLAPVEPEVNAELVAVIEHMLTEAKAGRIISLAFAGEQTGREIFTMFTGDFEVFRMLGAVEYLKTRLMASVEPG